MTVKVKETVKNVSLEKVRFCFQKDILHFFVKSICFNFNQRNFF